MSVDNDEGSVGIEMVDLEKAEDASDQDTEEFPADGKSYKDIFGSILTVEYDNEKMWWDAVEAELKKGGDFLEKVSCSSAFPQTRCISQAS